MKKVQCTTISTNNVFAEIEKKNLGKSRQTMQMSHLKSLPATGPWQAVSCNVLLVICPCSLASVYKETTKSETICASMSILFADPDQILLRLRGAPFDFQRGHGSWGWLIFFFFFYSSDG